MRRYLKRLLPVLLVILLFAIITPVYAQGSDNSFTTQTPAADHTLAVLLAGMLVFFMQAGFALLAAGSVRYTGVVNALTEIFVNTAITGLMFWAIGYGIAFGDSLGGLVGTNNLFLSEAVTFQNGGIIYATQDGVNMLALFFFYFALTAITSSIVTGAMAERSHFLGRLLYSAVISGVIIPVALHWVWGGGWLSQVGFIDFGGGAVIHLSGGVLALIGAAMLEERKGRVFGTVFPRHNLAFTALGTLILWFGWYAFNAGTALARGDSDLVALVMVNTTLAASAASLVALLVRYGLARKWELPTVLNGALAGLVAITAGCGVMLPPAAVLIGVIGGLTLILAQTIVEMSQIDDTTGAFAIHGANGLVGVLLVGLVGQPELGANGLFFSGDLSLFTIQIEGILAVVLWIGVSATVMFGALQALGWLRIPPQAEAQGIDLHEHGTTIWPDVLPVDEKATVAGD